MNWTIIIIETIVLTLAVVLKNNIMTIDTTNMCSHLQKKLFEENGAYHRIWIALQNDPELTPWFVHASFIFTAMARKRWFWPESLLLKL